MTTVITSKSRRLGFRDLAAGDVFTCRGGIFIKVSADEAVVISPIDNSQSDDPGPPGSFSYFSSKAEVCRVSEMHVVIEEN